MCKSVGNFGSYLGLSLNLYMSMKEEQQEWDVLDPFEFCKVCKLNHDKGRRHIYFPNHKKSLSLLLSKFQKKLLNLRFFLKNPTFLLSQQTAHNRLWCVFCDLEVQEGESTFACSNAIHHLASSDHLKNLKFFLWKYGGGIDKVDSFRVSEEDLDNWESSCRSMKSVSESSSQGSFAPSNNIHYEHSTINMDNFEKKPINSFEIRMSNSVLPLQFSTNESYQVSRLSDAEATKTSPIPDNNSLPARYRNMEYGYANCPESATKDLNVHKNMLKGAVVNSRQSAVGYSLRNGEVQRSDVGEGSNQVLQNLTRLAPLSCGEPISNVHSGAPPPWLETPLKNDSNHVSDSYPVGKSHKLNPKRVGAAWAEKRRVELEKEKRGEVVTSGCDADWLPNFGRVWQSGSRKESRKEFEMEKQKLFRVDNMLELSSIKLQPYISKRMKKSDSQQTEVCD